MKALVAGCIFVVAVGMLDAQVVLSWRDLSQVEKIESEIAELSPSELAAFRTWFVEFDASAWDRQFEADAMDGRLDALGEDALRDFSLLRRPEGRRHH